MSKADSDGALNRTVQCNRLLDLPLNLVIEWFLSMRCPLIAKILFVNNSIIETMLNLTASAALVLFFRAVDW
jgi:hypothetical protein